MDVLYIVIPAYNEEETISKVIAEWYPVIERHAGEGNSRLVVINDGSKDKTSQIVHELVQVRPLLELIDKENLGHGATLLFAYKYALKHKADYIFQTDSDGQTCAEEFETFWDQRNSYDVLIGERIGRKDGFSRVIVTKTLKVVLFMIFGIWVKDANTPFRLMKREVMEKYVEKIPPNYNLTNVMLSVFFLYYSESVKFIPISFLERQGG